MAANQSRLLDASVTHWLALSDHPNPILASGMPDVMQSGSLVLELTEPMAGGTVLLDYQSDKIWPCAVSIFMDSDAGVIVMHREGATLQRLHLPGPLAKDWHLARLTLTWDGATRLWCLSLEDVAGGWAHRAKGTNPMPLSRADCLALCAGPKAARKDASVEWFGICQAPPQSPSSTWIGHRTPIDTARGPVAAEDLRIGDSVATLDNGFQTLQAMQRYRVPNRGRFAPVLLRAPYFARQTDILVSQDQLTLLSGAAIEYLYGVEAALAPATALKDGNSAFLDARRQVVDCVSLDLGAPQLIFADGCPLLCSPQTAAAALPYRLLQHYEAQSLQSSLGRLVRHSAA